MRTLAVALLLTLTTACSVGGEQRESAATPSPSAPSDPGTPPDPGAGSSGSPACAEVRDGIRAFNAGDYPETVAHFRAALPIARAEADTDPSSRADDLLEAVQYYADLAPEDYPEAARSSAEFAKYKAITLGQCVPAPLSELPGGDPTSPGTDT